MVQRTQLSVDWLPPIRAFFKAICPRKLRTRLEFAEAEMILPSGPRRGMRFKTSFMPWTRRVLQIMDSGVFRRFIGSGPVQGGKTFIFLVIPAAYHLFEVAEDIIICAPVIELAQSVWLERILPALEMTRYKHLLPETGTGSRGGKAKSLLLLNGARVRFMGAGGSDAQRSSYTARVILATELDKMDQPGAVSREADPVKQFEARSSSFSEDALFYGECTMSIEAGRVYTEIKNGSDSRVMLSCPHCGTWQCPEREHFGGWEDAENEFEARATGAYACGDCGTVWCELDRRKALADPRIVHRGQVVEPHGDVVGPPPPTRTFGFRWNALHSTMRQMADIAEQEWAGERSEGTSAEKALCQFTWAIPWKDDVQGVPLTYALLARHAADYRFDPLGDGGDLPEGVDFCVGAVDVQKINLYWLIDGYNGVLTRRTLHYGVQEIIPEGLERDPTKADVRRALDAVRGQMAIYNCVSIWIDTGYKHEGILGHTVRSWCREQGGRVHALVGRSEGQLNKMKASGKQLQLIDGAPDMVQARKQPDGSILWFFDVDRIKDEGLFRLFREAGSPGYHYFPRDAANSDRSGRGKGPGNQGWIFSHFMRAKREITMVKGREKRVWIEKGSYHVWDCACYSLGGAMMTVLEVQANKMQAAAASAAASKQPKGWQEPGGPAGSRLARRAGRVIVPDDITTEY